jgi:hypothetical protein
MDENKKEISNLKLQLQMKNTLIDEKEVEVKRRAALNNGVVLGIFLIVLMLIYYRDKL